MLHEGFMRRALNFARKGEGCTSPNPAVGALVIKNNHIISKGYHKKAGLAHAEAVAISIAGNKAKGAILYVTLEPCCHYGRTPPCTDAIIRAGIKKVVIGVKDPNPKVCGKGILRLKKAGIEVVTGVLEDECRGLNEAYMKYITSGLPFVTLKLASSLDGKIALADGSSKWITTPESRRCVHAMRSKADAVMVGLGTVLKDDPQLNVRLVGGIKDPTRVIVDSSFRTPLSAKTLRRTGADKPTIVFTTRAASKKKIRKAIESGVEVIIVPKGDRGTGVDLKASMKELGKRGVTSLIIEGGPRLAASALKERLIDKITLFFAPVIFGSEGIASIGELGVRSISKAPGLKRVSVKKMGRDLLIEGYLH